MRCRTRPQPRPSRGRYANNPELAKREREENTPRGHPSFSGWPPASERERVRG
jgi:hypothetical protein